MRGEPAGAIEERQRPAAAIRELDSRGLDGPPGSGDPRGMGYSCWMDPEEAERVDRGAVSSDPCDR